MNHQSNTDLRNLILTIVLSLGFLFLWHKYVDAPRIQKEEKQVGMSASPTSPTTTAAPKAVLVDHDTALADKSHRLTIRSNYLHGSIDLHGLRLDDITLAQYKQTLDPHSPEVALLAPSNTTRSFFIDLGWLSTTAGIVLPDRNTLWQSDKTELTPNQPVTLSWINPQNIEFSITIHLDEKYLFTLEQKVVNRSAATIDVQSFGIISRAHDKLFLDTLPRGRDTSSIIHEGPLGVFDEQLNEISYKNLKEKQLVNHPNVKGWAGMSDKYWLAAFIPNTQNKFTARYSYASRNGRERYQTDIVSQSHQLKPNEQWSEQIHLYTGAKKVSLLDGYGKQLGIAFFDRAVDFGWLYFLTKPIFLLLQYFFSHIGNFGISILLLTVVVKLCLFPVANKSYETMTHMKHIQPKLSALKEKHKSDRMGMNKAVGELYKKEKLNPAFGCLGMLIQIPVAFALYKVLSVSIEMRHAGFYGWINDLSAPDPTSVFNLFGLIPWDPPSFLHIGAWPVIFAMTMFAQQSLQAKPSDPVQASVMKILPVFLLFLFTTFPSGLVIYFVWSNTLSIAQQWFINRRVEAKFKKRHAKEGA